MRYEVSTHAPTKGATALAPSSAFGNLFQPTRPRRARPKVRHAGQRADEFQPTRPRRARQHYHVEEEQHYCFNPRAHEGRDLDMRLLINLLLVFQPTRPRRARLDKTKIQCYDHKFQPTRPRRARQTDAVENLVKSVSTHAPTKGATASKRLRDDTQTFQPTRPRRARRDVFNFNLFLVCFNPRAHEGRDSTYHSLIASCPVSTHAPTKGATDDFRHVVRKVHVSTHAPTKGATRRQRKAVAVVQFQPTRPRRARRSPCWPTAHGMSFNPRAHEGRDFSAR